MLAAAIGFAVGLQAVALGYMHAAMRAGHHALWRRHGGTIAGLLFFVMALLLDVLQAATQPPEGNEGKSKDEQCAHDEGRCRME